MKTRVSFLFLVWIGVFQGAAGQISPGDLSSAHAHLEGMGNCTQCHTMGKSLSNENCLNCHTEIRTRIKEQRGLHASYGQKECVECHKEHHGRNFDLVRFEKNSFQHSHTGYSLEGKHAQLKCEQCHGKEKITANDIRSLSDLRKSRTYLGLGKECLSCHKDEHRGQLNKNCRVCHGSEGWKPAVQFSHANAAFRLTGSHLTVQCVKCHKKNLENGTVTQYTRIEHAGCRSCHADVHKGKFTRECSQCHSTESWHTVTSSAFSHASTLFPLKGKHTEVKCARCHPKDPKERNPSGGFGFTITKFAACMDCHSDAHAQQFAGRSDKGECSACHTEQGFAVSTYVHTDHEQSRFPLKGAHRAVPCIQCHKAGKVPGKSSQQFRWEREILCTTCHQDIHNGQFTSRMREGCETCHSVSSWDDLKFSHEQTGFPLKGKHTGVRCTACHTTVNGVVQYTGVSKNCESCHQDRHAGQFAASSGTACDRCHTEKGWRSLIFNHTTQSRFALTGKHETVKCQLCHKEALINNIRTTKYKPMEAACIDCHPAQ